MNGLNNSKNVLHLSRIDSAWKFRVQKWRMVATVVFVVFRAFFLSHVRKWHVGAMMVALLIFIGLVAMTSAPRAPETLLQNARMAISTARHARAAIYAPQEMSIAEATWCRTWQALRGNNGWFLLRDFSNPDRLAKLTTQQAEFAANRAVAVKDSLATVSTATRLAVKEKIARFQTTWEEIPLPRAQRDKLSQGGLLLAESEAALARGDLVQAASKAQAALAAVNEATAQTSKMLKSYFANLKQWRALVNETIMYSESAQCAVIIVDKLEHLCQVYVDGELHSEYDIELGPNWLGQKNRQGDNATPEGKYFIVEKKLPPETRYYKALEINYPNREDSLRFESAKQNGALPANARPGGLIEIHGDGGKDTDWTAGCVALQNEDMDEVYAIAKVGTPVTIVGSLHGLSKSQQPQPTPLRAAQ